MNLMADTSLFGLDVTKDLEDSKDKQVLTIYPPVFKMPGDGLNDLDSKAIAIRRFFKNFYFEASFCWNVQGPPWTRFHFEGL